MPHIREENLSAVPIVSKDNQILKILNLNVVKSLLPVDAVIMAGGVGSRLKPLTDNTPKPLLKVGNKEIISYILIDYIGLESLIKQ